ncbi:hypothetical protein Scep_008707 [Stephania cephalantha]|uniref:Uncharacterized protein n=1 Tax=Stephania cephalantha TaxID=152367 RepID=A0AAP0JRQ3_9MAGN
MRYAATIQRFLKVMAMVWAGSQVTKLARAAGALALAPLVDKGLAWFTVKFKFESKGRAVILTNYSAALFFWALSLLQAFTTIIGMCLVPGLVLFLTVTLLWA